MIALFTRHEPIDVMTLSEEMRKSGDLESIGGIAFLTELVDSVPSAANIEHYAKIVLDKHILRRLISASSDIARECYRAETDASSILDEAEQKIFRVSESRASAGFFHIKEIVKETFGEIERVHETRESITGLSTGFIDLDKYTAGFHPGDMVVIAGRPSMGKTSFALNIAQHVASHPNIKKTVAVFSLEMSKESLLTRLVCASGRVDQQKFRAGYLNKDERRRLSMAASDLVESQLFIDDSAGSNLMDIHAKLRRLKAEQGLGLVVIDYLQLMSGRGRFESRVAEVSYLSRGLKLMAKELEVPMLVLSQLSRAPEQRPGDHIPQLSDLRESGSIEQDADMVWFIFREEYYKPDREDLKGIADLIIGKQRNGPVGRVKLAFLREFTKFENLASDLGDDQIPPPAAGEDI